MASAKTEQFEAYQIRLAEMAKALAHPARIAIMEYLLRNSGTCVCGDIVAELPLAQSTVSQHLKVLKDAGLIKGEIEGVTTCYCADVEGCRELSGNLIELMKKATSCC